MIHVLYVDDEPCLLESGKKNLEESGDLMVDTARSARAALEMLGQLPYDAVVSDFQLPDMEGIEFLEKIQELVPGLPFIYFSQDDKPDTVRERGIKEGTPGYRVADKIPPGSAEPKRDLPKGEPLPGMKDPYRQIIENAVEGVVVVRDGIITYTNPAARKSLGGYAPEELEGRRFTAIVHPDDRGKVPTIAREQAAGDNLPKSPMRILTRQGEILCHGCRSIAIEWDGRAAVLNFLPESPGQDRAETELALANRKINLLNDLTRHDIANRLTVLRGRLKRVRKRIRDPDIIRQIEEVDNAGRDIFNLLEMARMYQEMGIISPQWFNLHSILDYGRILAEAPDLKVSVDTRDLEIYADPLCPRVFENIMENSLRHGNGVSEIRVATREADNGLVIILEDNGSGIPDEDKERIFRQGVGKHTGMGLFLSREILSITGITIRETGRTGKGARFEITVPRGLFRPPGSRQAVGSSCM